MLKLREQEIKQSSQHTPQETTPLLSPVSPMTIAKTRPKRFRYPVVRLLFVAFTLLGIAYFVMMTWREPSIPMAIASIGILFMLTHGILLLKDVRRIQKEDSPDLPGMQPIHYFVEATGYGLFTLAILLPTSSEVTRSLLGGGSLMAFPTSLLTLNSLFWGCFHTWEKRRKLDTQAER